jgi:7,8-dihydropterin-6-yl-methyl-4-(beta-D-ribofuranosyl)aminobenzene 5'-phosphate synthase
VEAFQRLGVKKIAPSHCTGDMARDLLAKAYREDFIRSGVGKVVQLT